MITKIITFLSEPFLYYRSEIFHSWRRHEGGYTCSYYKYKEFRRFEIILFRLFKLLAPFICVYLISLFTPVVSHNPVIWFVEYLLFFMLIQPIGDGIYPLMRKSIRSKIRSSIKYFSGD